MDTKKTNRFSTFITIWFGQIVSILGSGMTTFALGVWILNETGSVTMFTMISIFATLPALLLSPFAGVVVDRLNRRTVMLISDTGAGLSSIFIFTMIMTGNFSIPHIYIAMAVNSICNAFQMPAYTAAATQLVPKKQFAQASGMIQLGTAAGQIISPLIAGILMGFMTIKEVLVIDLSTYLVALVTLLIVRIPFYKTASEEEGPKKSVLGDLKVGFLYIWERKGLFGLLIFFAMINFLTGSVTVLTTPYILALADSATLGIVLAIGGLGMVGGSIFMSVWKGPKEKVKVILILTGVCGILITISGFIVIPMVFAAVAFLFLFQVPLINSLSQAIWMTKVDIGKQGRVFASRRFIAMLSLPIAYLLAGPLVDGIFKPALLEGGEWASTIGMVIGTGESRGIGFLFAVLGIITLLVAVGGLFFPAIRNVETDLPDAVEDDTVAEKVS